MVETETKSQVWALVTHHLEAFAKAWESGERVPDLAEHLPPGDSSARSLVLVELVKLDLDNRLQRGLDRSLEEYFESFPELIRDGIPCDLLYEDFHLRSRTGQRVAAKDYYRRFPSAADDLARLLGSATSTHSTSIAASAACLTLLPGDRIDDFDLLTLLGEGQFAKVFLARQRSMQRLVAVKASAMRGAEAQTLAQLDHPNIVRVYDQRLLAEQGLLLVYMPYLPGGTLHNVLQHSREVAAHERSGKTLLEAVDASLQLRGEVSPASSSIRADWAKRSWPAAVCALGVRLSAALDYAHDHGVLHRDVKPANILLTAEGEPLLADFNIGSCTKLDGSSPASMFGGSLPYMSPEHLEAFNPAHPREPESLDGRADIYSLAVTLWELITGARPFGEELGSRSWSKMLKELVRLRVAGPKAESTASLADSDVPGLKEVLLRCLDANPDNRPATAGEMARELELCLRPATRALLCPRAGGWKEQARRHPTATLLIAGLLPNILASIFNIAYNNEQIIKPWEAAQPEFHGLILALNGIFFPLGILLVVLAIRPVAAALKCVRAGLPISAEMLASSRERCLRLGSISAMVCAGCWAIAGLLWPAILRISAGPPPQGPEAYIHFLLSLVICGLIAAAYPYFIVTYIAVRVWYPALLGRDGLAETDGRALRGVEKELARYRVAAAAVPLIGVALLASRGASNTLAVALLCVAGLAGTLLAFAIEGRTRSDLAALARVPGKAGV